MAELTTSRPLEKRIAAPYGFTAIELLVVLLIGIILAALAGPSFARFLAVQNTKSAAYDLYASIFKLRSEAIAHNAGMSLTQNSGGWQNGWQIQDPTDPSVVLENRGSFRSLTINGPATVSYTPYGRVAGGTAPVFVLTSTAVDGVSQCVSIDLGGRPYIKKGTTC